MGGDESRGPGGLLSGRGALATGASAIPGTEFRAASGRPLKVVCGVEQILNVAGGFVGLRVTPTVIDTQYGRALKTRERARLDGHDFWTVDRLVLEAAAPLLADPTHPILVPLSFHSISRTRARDRLFEAAEVASDDAMVAMIAEIVGFDVGTPQGRLIDAISAIRPFASAVFVEALGPELVRSLVVNGVGGVTLDLRDTRGGDHQLVQNLRAFGAAGRGFVRTLVARGLPTTAALTDALKAGISHATVRGGVA